MSIFKIINEASDKIDFNEIIKNLKTSKNRKDKKKAYSDLKGALAACTIALTGLPFALICLVIEAIFASTESKDELRKEIEKSKDIEGRLKNIADHSDDPKKKKEIEKALSDIKNIKKAEEKRAAELDGFDEKEYDALCTALDHVNKDLDGVDLSMYNTTSENKYFAICVAHIFPTFNEFKKHCDNANDSARFYVEYVDEKHRDVVDLLNKKSVVAIANGGSGDDALYDKETGYIYFWEHEEEPQVNLNNKVKINILYNKCKSELSGDPLYKMYLKEHDDRSINESQLQSVLENVRFK